MGDCSDCCYGKLTEHGYYCSVYDDILLYASLCEFWEKNEG